MPAAFRLYSKLNTFYGSSGQALPGGYLKFYEAETTTPKDVYGEQALSTNNGARVDLDASSRPEHDIWGSGGYFVELYDEDDVKQGEADNVQIPGGEGQAVPVPDTGEFLTGDGVDYLVEDLTGQLIPDPTGHANKILGTDGTTVFWVDRPADGAAGVSDTSHTSTTFKVGDMLVQTGSGTASASGNKSSSVGVTFGSAFDSAPVYVGLTLKSGGVTSSGAFVRHAATSVTASGFTASFSTLTGGTSADSFSGSNITSAINFNWVAIGIKV